MPRTLAIGDVHGCSQALMGLLALVEPAAGDVVVTLGDYIDRGPDSRGVIEALIELGARCELVPLLGNHDQALLDSCRDPEALRRWLGFGGRDTLQSYGVAHPLDLPAGHRSFLEACLGSFETPTHLFVHANYLEGEPLGGQPRSVRLWESLRDRVPGPHCSGKLAVVGHTSQKNGEVLDLGHLTCIDTFCYGGGWLTALDVAAGRLWQVDAAGRPRPRPSRR